MISIRNVCVSIFIVTSTLSTATGAENIYKCGTSYSQTPCVDGKILNVDDTRDPQQKNAVDANIRRDTQLANDLEKARLIQERANLSTQTRQKVNAKTPNNPELTGSPTAAPTTITPKRIKPKPYKPAGFIALVPTSGSSHIKVKKTRKKVAATEQ